MSDELVDVTESALTCGANWDGQDVELYDETLGVSDEFVKQHEGPVGSSCSGTLITRTLWLTAGHCNQTVGSEVNFNAQINGLTGLDRKPVGTVATEVVEAFNNTDFDYRLIRLNRAPGHRFGFTRVADRTPATDENLVIMGFPSGRPKTITAGPYKGTSTHGPNWFRHRADTRPGSSGSGVLDTSGEIIGVHTDGACTEQDPETGYNRGLKSTALIDNSPTLQALGDDHIWWANQGSFTSAPSAVSNKYRPFSGDFDGDGDTDIFWYGEGSDTDRIWWASSSGSFTGQDTTVSGVYNPVAGNFDGDDDDDILWYDRQGGTSRIWWWSGTTPTSSVISVPGQDLWPFAGDFDGDGDDDIFWYAPGTDSDTMWWANGGSFTAQSITVNGKYLPIVGNFDGDGDDDIFWYDIFTPSSSRVWWWSGTSATDDVRAVSNSGYDPFAGDFDGDGDDEIFWYHPGSGQSAVWTYTGSTFTSSEKTVDGDYWPVVGNFNASTNDTDDDIFWYGF